MKPSRCVDCHRPIGAPSSAIQVQCDCGATYVHAPGGLSIALPAARTALRAARHSFRHWLATMQPSLQQHPDALLAVKRIAERLDSDLGMGSETGSEAGDALDVLRRALCSGWSLPRLLSSFALDWGTQRLDPSSIGELAARYPRSGSTLVLGCGGGELLAELADPARGETVGVDASLESLALAGRLLRGEDFAIATPENGWTLTPLFGRKTEGVTLVAADARELPWGDGSFARVVTHFVLDVIPDPMQAAKEIARVLEPGGVWLDESPMYSPNRGVFLAAAGFQPEETEALETQSAAWPLAPGGVLLRSAARRVETRRRRASALEAALDAGARGVSGGLATLKGRISPAVRVVGILENESIAVVHLREPVEVPTEMADRLERFAARVNEGTALGPAGTAADLSPRETALLCRSLLDAGLLTLSSADDTLTPL